MSTDVKNKVPPPPPLPFGERKPAVEVVQATFVGLAYRGGNGGLESEPFNVTVKIPKSYLERKDITPVGLFRQFFAKKALRSLPGYSGVRNCELIQVEGELPEGLKLDQRLNWTADRDTLVRIAEKYGKGSWQVIDGDNVVQDELSTKVIEELYPDAGDLRDAINRCRKEPQAFDREQNKRAGSDMTMRVAMEKELAALNDEDFD